MSLDKHLAILKEMRVYQKDEEIDPPSDIIIDRAMMLTKLFSTLFYLPTRVVMNGEGGVAFEWKNGSRFTTLEINRHRLVEICRYEDCKLVDRTMIGEV